MSQRVDCEHADRCGGCPLLDRTYEEQLARKHARVREAMGRYPSLALAVAPVAAADPVVGYRTRAKLMVGPDGALGLFAKGGGHEVVDGPGCRVLAPVLAAAASVIRARARAAAASGGPLAPFEAGGSLRAVDLREVREAGAASARVLVTLVVDRARAPELATLREAARHLMAAVPAVAGVAANFHHGTAPQVLGSETVPLAGATRAPDRVGASLHFATFGSFVQAHRGQTARVHAMVAEAARRGRVLDLYGGSGAIGLALAAGGARVTLVESFAPAVEQARAAARAQDLELEAICADAAEALGRVAGPVDAIVVNPPRRGTSPRVRVAIAKAHPAAIAYVSCDPSTLARDLATWRSSATAPRRCGRST